MGGSALLTVNEWIQAKLSFLWFLFCCLLFAYTNKNNLVDYGSITGFNNRLGGYDLLKTFLRNSIQK